MGLEIQLDPDLMAGQMVVGGFEGKTLPAEMERALSRGRLSGVILFNRNLGSPEEVRALTDAIRSASSLPPIIAVDQEGGRVQRLSPPFTRWPSMRALGARDSKTARELASAIAAEMMAVGINTNLAPVLDVDSNPGCSVIADRGLGPDPNKVAHLGAAMIQAYREAGVISCAKHFPGHGDTTVDSHDDLPVSETDRSTLERRELIPFGEAIKARVPMIMTAHLKATALDPYYPATISRPIINDLLREEMGFDGVIITDDLMMGALMKYMPLKDAAFSAARAGADLLLVCSGPAAAEEARKTIVDGLHQGILDFGQTTLSVRRVVRIKEEYLMKKLPAREKINEVVGSGKHKELAETLT
ncbi:MAG TPA: beta-N-acetylhexosaminidase [bacterium]|nr:beta-N-acetylhexosaminidase [bacterium]